MSITNASGSITVAASGGPAFSAYQSSSQGLSASTWTKIEFQTEEFDTASAFDSTTNYRFTPLTAGYYQFNAAVYSGSSATLTQLYFYKNDILLVVQSIRHFYNQYYFYIHQDILSHLRYQTLLFYF